MGMPLSFALKPETGISDEEKLLTAMLDGSVDDKAGTDELATGCGFGVFKNIKKVVINPNKMMMGIKSVFFSVFTPSQIYNHYNCYSINWQQFLLKS